MVSVGVGCIDGRKKTESERSKVAVFLCGQMPALRVELRGADGEFSKADAWIGWGRPHS